MKNDDILYGKERTFSGNEPVLPRSVKLAKNGYNLIGHFGLIEKTISDALSSLTFGGNYYWHKVYDANHKEVTGVNMTSGEGYWLAMKDVVYTTGDYYTYFP